MSGYKVVIGASLAAVGAAFLGPFVQAAITNQDVDLWPNPLFIIPLCLLGGGLLLLFSPALRAVLDY